MLVLSRKATECIYIGDSVVVTLLEIRGNIARIGIEAPKEVHILRGELRRVTAEPSTGLVPPAVVPVEA